MSRFTEMHVTHTIVEARCLELKAELSNLRDKIHNDNHNELVNRFSNLEVHHLNMQLKYQNLKDSFGNNPPTPAKDTLDFDSVFVIKKMQASLQGNDNVIKQLKKKISHLQETCSEADRTLDFRALDSQITQLTEKVTVLQAQNYLFRAEIEKLSSTTKNSQILNNVNSVIKDHVKPTVLTPGKYAIDVEPIPPLLRNNREAHLDYLIYLKESMETISEIVEEAKVVRPLDSSIVSACRYTKHSQELLEYFIETVRFRNDHFGAIMGYGDYVIGDSMISRVYYVEGLGHNLFFVEQFCDSDQEVTFRKHSCYVRDTDGVELIKGSGGSNLYTILVEDMMKSSLIFLLSKAFKNKSWLWHGRLNHLNFGTINDLARKDLVREAVATCYTQNRSLIHTRHNKTPYELVHNKKPNLTFFRVFGALCYPTNDSKDLGKLQPIADIGIFVGYAPSCKGYRLYNKRTRRLMETIHIQFDELTEPMALLHLKPPRIERPVSPASAVPVPVNSSGTPSSTTIDQDAPSLSHSPSSSALHSLSLHQGVAAESTHKEDNPVAPVDNNPFIIIFSLEPSSYASSSGDEKGQSRLEVILDLDEGLLQFIQQVFPKQSPSETVLHQLSLECSYHSLYPDNTVKYFVARIQSQSYQA
nr:integrase, catalytic region, zinc finger, CCHC-type, peptidase aspartic, catalytic [Tanacetum cinerariifolium]